MPLSWLKKDLTSLFGEWTGLLSVVSELLAFSWFKKLEAFIFCICPWWLETVTWKIKNNQQKNLLTRQDILQSAHSVFSRPFSLPGVSCWASFNNILLFGPEEKQMYYRGRYNLSSQDSSGLLKSPSLVVSRHFHHVFRDSGVGRKVTFDTWTRLHACKFQLSFIIFGRKFLQGYKRNVRCTLNPKMAWLTVH